MALERIARKTFIIDVVYMVLVGILVLFAATLIIKYLLPFVIGTVIAFLVQKPSRFLSEKIILSQGVIAAILSVLLYLLVGVSVTFLGYKLAVFLVGFMDFLPDLFDKISKVLEKIFNAYSPLFSQISEKFDLDFNEILNDTLKKLLTFVVNFISEFISKLVKGAPAFFISSIVTLVATCLIAKDFEHLTRFIKMLIGKTKSRKITKIKDILFGSVLKLFKGYILLSSITILELYVGFLVLRVDYALSLAIIIGFVDLLPILGTGTVLVPWSIISVLLGNFSLGIGIAVLFIITVIVRNFCEPKIISMQIGISPLFTLMSMFLGLRLFGVMGLVLFPVIFIVVIRYYKQEMEEGLSV